MRWLVDECVHGHIARQLRNSGHDVLTVVETFPSLEDGPILSAASAEHRILLTQDLDFGELVFRRHFPAVEGIVLLRMRLHSIDAVWQRLRAAIEKLGDSLLGQYVVVEENRIRCRALK